jgi:hypothetical protein
MVSETQLAVWPCIALTVQVTSQASGPLLSGLLRDLTGDCVASLVFCRPFFAWRLDGPARPPQARRQAPWKDRNKSGLPRCGRRREVVLRAPGAQEAIFQDFKPVVPPENPPFARQAGSGTSRQIVANRRLDLDRPLHRRARHHAVVMGFEVGQAPGRWLQRVGETPK